MMLFEYTLIASGLLISIGYGFAWGYLFCLSKYKLIKKTRNEV